MTLSKTVQPAVSIIVSLPGQPLIEDENRENDGGKPAGAEPADEKLVHRTRPRTDQAKKHREHPDPALRPLKPRKGCWSRGLKRAT